MPERIQPIDTGDHVFHVPTRETWLVRRVDGNFIEWCGWPPGRAWLEDCRLVYKATPAERDALLLELDPLLLELDALANKEADRG